MGDEHEHEHAGGNETGGTGKEPAEQEALARDLGDELADSFLSFVRGEISFAELSFLAYEALQDVYSIAAGDYELEFDDGDEDEAEDQGAAYSPQEAVIEQEDLAQEPARDKAD